VEEEVVHSTFELWLIGLIGVSLGGALGYWLPRFMKSAPLSGRETEAELEALRERHATYRNDVANHFNQTAELLDKLIGNYRDVHNHLADGAETLCEDETIKLVKRLPDDRILEQRVSLLTEAPRDYAPKITTGTKSVLDEDFGIEKIRRAAVPEPPRY
jgi:uncharacterized membrane-anchored protein YhcB (DUF1043 family)